MNASEVDGINDPQICSIANAASRMISVIRTVDTIIYCWQSIYKYVELGKINRHLTKHNAFPSKKSVKIAPSHCLESVYGSAYYAIAKPVKI